MRIPVDLPEQAYAALIDERRVSRSVRRALRTASNVEGGVRVIATRASAEEMSRWFQRQQTPWSRTAQANLTRALQDATPP